MTGRIASGDRATRPADQAPAGLGDAASVPCAEHVQLGPLPVEQYSRLSDRERMLHAIADQIGYWIKWETRQFASEGIRVTPDTHIWLNGYDGSPPTWPSVGQLARWITVLRASPEFAASGMSAFGQDGEARLEAKPASPTAEGGDAPTSPDTPESSK